MMATNSRSLTVQEMSPIATILPKDLRMPSATILGLAGALIGRGSTLALACSSFNTHPPLVDGRGLEAADQDVLQQVSENGDQHDPAVDHVHAHVLGGIEDHEAQPVGARGQH